MCPPSLFSSFHEETVRNPANTVNYVETEADFAGASGAARDESVSATQSGPAADCRDTALFQIGTENLSIKRLSTGFRATGRTFGNASKFD
jgi:hypothetical protein